VTRKVLAGGMAAVLLMLALPQAVAASTTMTGRATPPTWDCPYSWSYESASTNHVSFYDYYLGHTNTFWARITTYYCIDPSPPSFTWRYYQSQIWLSYPNTYYQWPLVSIRAWDDWAECSSGCIYQRAAMNEYSNPILQGVGGPFFPPRRADNQTSYVYLPYNGLWYWVNVTA